MTNRNWCVLEKGPRYLHWSRVGLWCATRADANVELRRLQRIFPGLKLKVGQSLPHPVVSPGLSPRPDPTATPTPDLARTSVKPATSPAPARHRARKRGRPGRPSAYRDAV
jgi:hypothetical protein